MLGRVRRPDELPLELLELALLERLDPLLPGWLAGFDELRPDEDERLAELVESERDLAEVGALLFVVVVGADADFFGSLETFWSADLLSRLPNSEKTTLVLHMNECYPIGNYTARSGKC